MDAPEAAGDLLQECRNPHVLGDKWILGQIREVLLTTLTGNQLLMSKRRSQVVAAWKALHQRARRRIETPYIRRETSLAGKTGHAKPLVVHRPRARDAEGVVPGALGN